MRACKLTLDKLEELALDRLPSAFEELDGAFVVPGRGPRAKCSEVPAFAGLWID
jgi:hypothetical protein